MASLAVSHSKDPAPFEPIEKEKVLGYESSDLLPLTPPDTSPEMRFSDALKKLRELPNVMTCYWDDEEDQGVIKVTSISNWTSEQKDFCRQLKVQLIKVTNQSCQPLLGTGARCTVKEETNQGIHLKEETNLINLGTIGLYVQDIVTKIVYAVTCAHVFHAPCNGVYDDPYKPVMTIEIIDAQTNITREIKNVVVTMIHAVYTINNKNVWIDAALIPIFDQNGLNPEPYVNTGTATHLASIRMPIVKLACDIPGPPYSFDKTMVEKYGAESHRTVGKLVDYDASRIDVNTRMKLHDEIQIAGNGFGQPGDSGSLILQEWCPNQRTTNHAEKPDGDSKHDQKLAFGILWGKVAGKDKQISLQGEVIDEKDCERYRGIKVTSFIHAFRQKFDMHLKVIGIND